MIDVKISALVIANSLALVGAWGESVAGEARFNTEGGYSTFPRLLPPPSKEELQKGAAALKLPVNLKVPSEWVPILNRATEEFWTEGNHRPDAGFVLFARNPSRDNAKLWLLRMEAKAKALTEMYAYVAEAQTELLRDGLILDRFPAEKLKAGTLPARKETANKSTQITDAALRELQFYFLFSPTCPHCESMAETLIPFPNVVPLQVTGTKLRNFSGLLPTEFATSETKNAYLKGGATPVLVISHPQKNLVTTLVGDKSAEDILLAAASLLNASPQKQGHKK